MLVALALRLDFNDSISEVKIQSPLNQALTQETSKGQHTTSLPSTRFAMPLSITVIRTNTREALSPQTYAVATAGLQAHNEQVLPAVSPVLQSQFTFS
jgi:hypothetical protein